MVPVGKDGHTRTHVVCRKIFDQGVVAQAMEAGAHLWLMSKPIEAEVREDRVELKIEREGEIIDIQCDLLIGADGAHSWTRRHFKMGRPKEMMIGFQADVSGLSGKDNWLEMYTGRDIAPGLFAWVIPTGDNKFSALNSAVMSGGSFIYIPPGVKVKHPLQAYFRITSENFGQFERTLIIADEDGTQIEINGSPYNDPVSGKNILNAGEHFFVEGTSYSATSPLQYMYITSNKNVYLFQGTGDKYTVLNRNNRHNYSANQGMFFVPQLNCASTGDVESIAKIDEVDGGTLYGGGAFSGSAFVLSKYDSAVTLNGAPIGPQANAEINVPIGGVDTYTIHRVNDIVGDVTVIGSDELYVSYFHHNFLNHPKMFYMKMLMFLILIKLILLYDCRL